MSAIIFIALIAFVVLYVMVHTPSSSSDDDAYYKDRDLL